jgi:hypothetical protein
MISQGEIKKELRQENEGICPQTLLLSHSRCNRNCAGNSRVSSLKKNPVTIQNFRRKIGSGTKDPCFVFIILFVCDLKKKSKETAANSKQRHMTLPLASFHNSSRRTIDLRLIQNNLPVPS